MFRTIRKFHRWSAWLIGIQCIIWLITGLFFNVVDLSHYNGKDHLRSQSSNMNALHTYQWYPLYRVLNRYAKTVEVKTVHLLDTPYYLLTQQKGLYRHFYHEYVLVDAQTGQPQSIDSEFALQLANHSYDRADKPRATVSLVESLDDFPKEQNTAYQINYADQLNTKVYIEASSGRLIGHSNDLKRIRDLMFILHFMDYANKGSFNHIIIVFSGFVCLWLVFSGGVWLLTLLKRRQFI